MSQQQELLLLWKKVDPFRPNFFFLWPPFCLNDFLWALCCLLALAGPFFAPWDSADFVSFICFLRRSPIDCRTPSFESAPVELKASFVEISSLPSCVNGREGWLDSGFLLIRVIPAARAAQATASRVGVEIAASFGTRRPWERLNRESKYPVQTHISSLREDTATAPVGLMMRLEGFVSLSLPEVHLRQRRPYLGGK